MFLWSKHHYEKFDKTFLLINLLRAPKWSWLIVSLQQFLNLNVQILGNSNWSSVLASNNFKIRKLVKQNNPLFTRELAQINNIRYCHGKLSKTN